MPAIGTDSLLSNGLAQLRSGQLDEAEAAFRRILKSHPKQQDALHFLGMVAYQRRRYDQAVMWIHRAIKAAPAYAEAHNNLGMMLLELRKPKEAEAAFRRAVALRQGYAAALANLGDSLREQARFEEAARWLGEAVKYDPRNLQARYKLASTLLSLGSAAEALEQTAACLAIDPYCQHALAFRAAALRLLDRQDEAAILVSPQRDVAKIRIGAPPEFADQDDFNRQLEASVRTHPSLSWEPSNRVTRGGAVSQDMLEAPDAVITAFAQVLRSAIDAYRDALSPWSTHPYYGRRPQRYRLTLIASILRSGGHHPFHLHESSWLSGCYYVKVPQVVTADAGQRAGWIEFGWANCPLPVDGTPPAEAFAPEAGFAFCFPSYYFHGTIPFAGDEERIGIAFDVYPED